jgi:hypothetical protein
MPKAAPLKTVSKAKYDKVVEALGAALVLLADMEKAGALRLPFPNFIKTVEIMKAARR